MNWIHGGRRGAVLIFGLHHLTLAALQPEVHCSHIGTESPVCFDGA